MKKNTIKIQQYKYAPEQCSITLNEKTLFDNYSDTKKINIDTYYLYTLSTYQEKVAYIRKLMRKENTGAICKVTIQANKKVLVTNMFNTNLPIRVLKKLGYKAINCKPFMEV